RFAQMIATRSPAAMPAACNVPAVRAAATAVCAKLQLASPALASGLSPWRCAWRASIAGSVRSAGAKACASCRGNADAALMVSGLSAAEIARDHLRVVDEVRGLALMHDRASLQHIGEVGGFQR